MSSGFCSFLLCSTVLSSAPAISEQELEPMQPERTLYQWRSDNGICQLTSVYIVLNRNFIANCTALLKAKPHQEVQVGKAVNSPGSHFLLSAILCTNQVNPSNHALVDSWGEQNLISQDLVNQLHLPIFCSCSWSQLFLERESQPLLIRWRRSISNHHEWGEFFYFSVYVSHSVRISLAPQA